MSPLQVQTRTRPSDEKKVRRRSNHRLSQQQAARAHGNRRPSLRRTSRQSILGRKTMGVSEDPFPSGTDRSPVDSSLGAITSAWEEHCRRADDTVASNQEQRNNIDRPCAPADIQVSHEPSVFSVLAAYNAPLRINVTVETMTISTTSGWVKSTATTNAVANAHHVERQLPRLSVPEFSPFNVQSLDPFHESISGLLFTQPAPTTTISSSNFSTPLITPEASPRSTMGHGHEVVVHENNVSADGIRTSEIGDEGETGESTGVKERKKPKLTLDMGVVGEYPTVSRRKGEIVLIRESIGSSRRKAAAKAPEPDQLTNNGS
ncbi:hypothetical protein FRC17_005663 [Serendipita sp. 399]|nr:hypothetical protein FRC17_005663 [Serendipita sp. 399]